MINIKELNMRFTASILFWSAISIAICFGSNNAALGLPVSGDVEVSIETASPDIRIAGTLSIPQGNGPHPAVILLAGSGPHTRDQLISGSPMFRYIAERLSSNGIAVLRFDKRGMGDSTGPKDINDSTLTDFVDDAQSCFQFLKKRAEIDPNRIGLIGHSEGAIVGPMLGVKEPSVRFLVLIAPPAVSGAEIWIKQRLFFSQQRGVKAEKLAALEKELRRLVEFVVAGKNDDETYYRLGHDFLAIQGVQNEKITHELIDKVISDLRTKGTEIFFTHDPAKTLAKLSMPILAVLSSADDQVSVEQNLAPLAQALLKARHTDFSITVMPEQDHFFLNYEGRRLKKHQFGKMRVNADLLDLMTVWIQKHVK